MAISHVTFAAGQDVDVWCPSTQCWSPGFRVVSADLGGIRVERISDGDELPAVFSADQVRAADTVRDHRGPVWAGARRAR